MGEFQDKNILITGASKGLGYVCSRAFESQGARLVVAARSLDKLEELRNSFLDPSKHLAFAGDLVDQKNIKNLVSKGLEHTGGFDIVLHVLGGGYGFRDPLPHGINWRRCIRLISVLRLKSTGSSLR